LGEAGGITAGPRQASDHAAADRVGGIREYDRYGAGRPLKRQRHDTPGRENDVGCKRDQFRGMATIDFWVTCSPAEVDAHIPADAPARFLQPLQECRETPLSFRIFCGEVHEHADPAHFLPLLRSHRNRPRHCRAAEQRDELAASYVNHGTSSAAAVRARAVLTSTRRLGICRRLSLPKT
jgi:hypothetical protein